MTRPKGIIVPIGGAEDKGKDLDPESRSGRRSTFFREGVLKRIADLLPRAEDSILEIITAACSDAAPAYDEYKEAFAKLGFVNVRHFGACTRSDVDSDEYLNRAVSCDLVFMAGGDQLRLSSVIGGTRLLTLLKDRFRKEKLIIAGTSAGAMVMGNTMIAEGSAKEAHIKGALMMAPGVGILSEVVVDTHFNQRGRFNRIAQSVTASPGVLGIGFDEDTGGIITEGRILEIIGSGTTTIIDGQGIGYNNIGNIGEDEPLSVEGLKVHLLTKGDRYDLKARTVTGK